MQFFLPYPLRWCYVTLDNFLHVSRFTCCQEWVILNPSFSLCSRDLFDQSTSSLELSWYRFHLKPSLRNVAIVVPINDPNYLYIVLLEEVFFISLVLSIILFVSVVAEFFLNFEKFSISPLQAYSFRCWFSNNPVVTILEGCFPSSFVAQVGVFFSILLFQWSIFYSFFRRHCDVALFTHHLELWGSCSFLSYPFNRRVVFSFEFSHLIKFCFSFQPECCLNSSSLILL